MRRQTLWSVGLVIVLSGCGDTPLPPATVCSSVGSEGKGCDDKDPCTENDKCQGNVCKGAALKCDAPPSSVCQDDTTLTLYTSPGTCSQGKCSYGSATVPCSMGCDSAAGSCKGDPCKGITCDQVPSNCHKSPGICVSGSCTYLFDDGKSCDDSNSCTDTDVCAAGKCGGAPKVCNSPPKKSCKNATTALTYDALGTCSNGQCDYRATEVACGTPGCDSATGECKTDPCAGVTCTTPPNTCYKSPGKCASGKCTYDYDDTKTCNDGNACTETDTCLQGTCKGSPISCNTPPASKCKDANTVTVYTAPGTCSGGTCTYGQADVPCSYGCDSATGKCKGDPCTVNPCTTPPNTACFSTPGVCSSTGGQVQCTYLPKTNATCNDNNLCTYGDKCDSAGTCAGTTYTCNDGLTCTVDACNGTGGCTYTPNSGFCAIGAACYATGAANPSAACQVCDPSKNNKAWSVTANNCAIGITCYAAGTVNPSVACQVCDPAKTQTAWSVTAGKCAIYGTCYDLNAPNPSVTCQLCDPAKSQTTWSLAANTCYINYACYANGAANPSNSCQTCVSATSTSAWQTGCSSGTVLTTWNFDSGLQSWTITPNAAYPTSPVKWQIDTQRADTPTQSLYFGNVATHTFDDPGKIVSGAATSPSVTLPAAAGKLCVRFRLWKMTEMGTTFDQVTLTALPANTIVWKSGDAPSNGNTTASGGFITFVGGLTAFAGQAIQLKLFFNSVDSIANSSEGAYVDTIQVMSNCTP